MLPMLTHTTSQAGERTHVIKTFTIDALKELHPDGCARALRDWQNGSHEIPWQDETIDSLKACLKAAGVRLRDWSLGAYNRGNFISVSFDNDDTEGLSGKRAMTWLENNLFGPVRIPWSGKGRNDVRKYGVFYRPGLIRPCPFTGYCTDEDYMSALRQSVRDGQTLKDAFRGLADVCMRLLEDESEAMYSEEYFVEDCQCNDVEFTEDGERF